MKTMEGQIRDAAVNRAVKFVFDQEPLAHGKGPGYGMLGAPVTPLFDNGVGVEEEPVYERSILALAQRLGLAEGRIRNPKTVRVGKGWQKNRGAKDEGRISLCGQREEKLIAVDFGGSGPEFEVKRPVFRVNRQRKGGVGSGRNGELIRFSDRDPGERVRIEDVQRVALDVFEVDRLDLFGRVDTRAAVWARIASMALCHKHTTRTVEEIAQAHGRTKAVASRAVKRFEVLRQKAGAFAAAVARVELMVVGLAHAA